MSWYVRGKGLDGTTYSNLCHERGHVAKLVAEHLAKGRKVVIEDVHGKAIAPLVFGIKGSP
jgi:hypothetical protein